MHIYSIRTYKSTHTYIRTHTHTFAGNNGHTYTHIHTFAGDHGHIYTHIHNFSGADGHTYTHIRTFAGTNGHTYTHTLLQVMMDSSFLEYHDITDYSLLVGVHAQPEIATTTQTARPRSNQELIYRNTRINSDSHYNTSSAMTLSAYTRSTTQEPTVGFTGQNPSMDSDSNIPVSVRMCMYACVCVTRACVYAHVPYF